VGLAENSYASVVNDEIRISEKKKIIILGGGPNRIGQGIEFDYCCVQAAFAAKELGFESVMVNSNPETVSTDYATTALLFFEPLTHEDVLNIVGRLNGKPLGVLSPLFDPDNNLQETREQMIAYAREHGLGRCGVLETQDGGRNIYVLTEHGRWFGFAFN